MEQRRLRRRLHVRLRREEPDEPRLPDDLAVLVHLADADVVHPGAPVHASSRSWSSRRRAGRRPRCASARRGRGPRAASGRRTSSAARRTGCRARSPGTARIAPRGSSPRLDELVLAVAEQHEVQLREPLEEVDRLADLLRRVAHRARASELDHVPHAFLHRLEVAHDEPHVAQDRPEPVARGRRASSAESGRSSSKCITDSRWLASRPDITRSIRPVLVADRAHHGVQQEADAEAPSQQLLLHRVHEERRVVGVGLDDRPGGLVAVGLGIGIEDPDRRRVRPAAVGELERRPNEPEETLDPGRLAVLVARAAAGTSSRTPRARRVGRAPLAPRSSRSAAAPTGVAHQEQATPRSPSEHPREAIVRRSTGPWRGTVTRNAARTALDRGRDEPCGVLGVRLPNDRQESGHVRALPRTPGTTPTR